MKNNTRRQPGAEAGVPTDEVKGESNPTPITLHVEPAAGKPGMFVVESRSGGSPLHRDTFDLNVASRRTQFVKKTLQAAFPGEDGNGVSVAVGKDLDRQLIAIAQSPPVPPPPEPPTAELSEVDLARVLRPELFHVPWLSGLTVPVMSRSGERLIPRWRTYLCWADGRREVMDRPDTIPLPGDQRLFLRPDPGEPATSEPPAWSSDSRTRWLGGAAAPDPAAVFRRVCRRIADFLDFAPDEGPGTTAVLALWTLLTYLYPAWDAVPYLFVGGPMSSGKSRLLEVLARLVFRPLVTANLTAPALFRTLHARGGTMIYDEAERLRQATPDMQELNAVFLAGYRRGATATRLEPVGDSFRPVHFEVYGPKALACIAGLPPTLASRCIPVMMFRAAAGSAKPKRRLDADPEVWAGLRDDLHVLALEHGPRWPELAGRLEVVPDGLGGRNYELWQSILALAEWLEGLGARRLLGLVQQHALRTVEASQDDAVPDADETLLEVLAEAVLRGDQVTPGEVLAAAKERSPKTFDTWHPAAVSRRLKTYGIPTPKKSNGVRRYRRDTLVRLERVQTNYGIDLGLTPEGGRGNRP